MIKRILSLLLAVMFIALLPISAGAAPLDTQAPASLTLEYNKDGKAFDGLSIEIYRVAEALPDGSYALASPFSAYPVNIHDITKQAQWNTVTSTLCACIAAEGAAPTSKATTDAYGNACFDGLETGLYLVNEVITSSQGTQYSFNAFMVYLPTPDENGYNYNVTAKPKCTSYTNEGAFTVTKLWQDDKNSPRPEEVVVDIYKNNALYDTCRLNSQNNWTYTWKAEAASWTVAERSVPEGYKMTVRRGGSVFTIINTCLVEEEKPPKMGDSFALLPYIIMLAASVILLIIVAIMLRRRA